MLKGLPFPKWVFPLHLPVMTGRVPPWQPSEALRTGPAAASSSSGSQAPSTCLRERWETSPPKISLRTRKCYKRKTRLASERTRSILKHLDKDNTV